MKPKYEYVLLFVSVTPPGITKMALVNRTVEHVSELQPLVLLTGHHWKQLYDATGLIYQISVIPT